MKFLIFCLLEILAVSLTCPSFTFANSTCLPCSTTCSLCASSITCTTCASGYFLNSNGACSRCPVNCLTCSNSTTCNACWQPYVLVNSTCSLCNVPNAATCSALTTVDTCLSGYYSSTSYCGSCPLHCSSCINATYCAQCNLGYYLQYQNSVCSACSNCGTCSGTSTNCTSCSNGYQLVSNTCQNTSCGITNCAYCNQNNLCSNCNSNYYLSGNVCVFGSSALCSNGALGSWPNNCKGCGSNSYPGSTSGDYTYCIPYASLNSGAISQLYGYMFNDYTTLFPSASLTNNCNDQSYIVAPSNIVLVIDNYYTLTLTVKGYSLSVSPSVMTINLTDGLTSQTQNISLSGACQPVIVSMTSTTLNSNPLTLQFQNSASFGLIQFLIVNKLCTAGCVRCLNAQLCQQCASPNYLLNYGCVSDCGTYYRLNQVGVLSCVISCPDGYYAYSNTTNYCLPCTPPCGNCMNATLCFSCTAVAGVNYYYLSLNNTCMTVCPDSYFQNGTSCSPCLSPCGRCTSQTTCLSCVQGYWNGSSCASQCTGSTYADSQHNSCENCSGCLTCIYSPTICTGCAPGLILFDSNCISSCSDGYYQSGSSCLKCVSPCLTCSSVSSCSSCSVGYLNGTTCASTCPTGTYANVVTQICILCNSSCSSCISQTQCTACNNNYCLQLSICVPSSSGCLSLYYQITVGNQCSCAPCSYPCRLCTNQTSCVSCLSGYLFGTSCLPTCPSSYYADSGSKTCIRCASVYINCSECSDSACTSCQSGYLYNQFTNSSAYCVATCPSTLYNNSQSCVYCLQPCLTCISSTKCLTCVSGYAFNNNSCVLQCNSGQYLTVTSGLSVCLSCVSPCQTCSNITQCTSCLRTNATTPQTYLFNGSCASCPTGFYSQLVSLECVNCLYPCLTCTSQSQCLSCIVGFYNSTSKSCSQCSQGTYANITTMTCRLCKSNCTACTTSSDCSRCVNNTYLKAGDCLTAIECSAYSGFYVNILSSACTGCVTPCSACSSETACLSCQAGYMYFNSTCLVVCPVGYFNNIALAICTQCPSKCLTCSGPASCFTCQTGYSYYRNKLSCLSSCPSRTYIVGTQCLDCKYPCLQCTTESSCVSCQSGIILQSNMSCITTCPSSYFSLNSNCQPCGPLCLQCSSTSNNCTSCPVGSYLYNNNCTTTCPDGFFGDQQVWSCFACVAPCEYCLDQITCSKCPDQYSFIVQLNQCTLVCPSSYFTVVNNSTSLSASKNLCMSCQAQCTTCSSPYTCDLCVSGVQFNGTCLTVCPSTMYPQNGVCNQCTLPCYQCTSTTVCKSCLPNAGYLLVASSQCFYTATCPEGYLLQPSGISCETTCPTSYYNELITRQCVTQCPSDNFKGTDSNCYESCPASTFGNSSYFCEICAGSCPDRLLNFGISTQLNFDSLLLVIDFNIPPVYTTVIKQSSIIINPPIPFQISSSTESQITLQLLPADSVIATTLSVRFLSPFVLFNSSLPLQNPIQFMVFKGYNYYGTTLPNLTSLSTALAVISALIAVWVGYLGLDFVQTIFLYNLVNIHYPPHLASFLQGFKASHFYFPVLDAVAPAVGKFKSVVTNMSFLGNSTHGLVIIGAASIVSLTVLIVQRLRSSKITPAQLTEKPLDAQPLWVRFDMVSLLKVCLPMKVFYCVFSYLMLFSICELINWNSSPTSQVSRYISPLVFLLLIAYPCTLLLVLQPKPFLYCLLLVRKLIVCICIVVAMNYPIYIFGLMAVISLSTFVLLLTHNPCKWRVEFVANSVGEMAQLLMACLFSALTFFDQGTETVKKVNIAYAIIVIACLGIVLYTTINVILIVCWFILKLTGRDLIGEWSKVQETVSAVPEPQSEDDSAHQIKINRSGSRLGTNLGREDVILEAPHHQEESARGDKQSNSQFRVYSDNEDKSEVSVQNAPDRLIKVVNQFEDYSASSVNGESHGEKQN